MRLRYVKDGIQKMIESKKVIINPEDYKDRWQELFKNDNPLHAEFGSGRGGFLMELAKRNPGINYLAFERNSKVIVKGLNAVEDIPENFYFVHSDVRKLEDIFSDNALERIYLNFPDPWPKERHKKRRLTFRKFLYLYEKILIPRGELQLKTDNPDFFEFSLNELIELKWSIETITRDLHNSIFSEDNVMTEYERKFKEEGKKINMCKAMSPKN